MTQQRHTGADMHLQKTDPDVYAAIQKEIKRQNANLELIASENFVSQAVLEAQGSVLTNKYAEGYPHARWYNGCENVDVVETDPWASSTACETKFSEAINSRLAF